MSFQPDLNITVRIGCEIVYETNSFIPAFMVLRPRRSPTQRIDQETLTLGPNLPSTEETDSHGNIVDRVVLRPGVNTIRHDALISVSSLPETVPDYEMAESVENIPGHYLRYTLPSRYCDSDKLMNFASERFSFLPPGGPTIRGIVDWLHKNIEYRYGSGCPDISASEVLARGYGVCRDFAHTAVALCRTFNLPCRYVTGHLPDIGFQDPGTDMDFHAYFEVYLSGKWVTVDARFNTPRIGRIKIAVGMDAVDGAFSTLYGSTYLASFKVWAYQVDPAEVKVDSPIDLSKRLDGTPQLRWPQTQFV